MRLIFKKAFICIFLVAGSFSSEVLGMECSKDSISEAVMRGVTIPRYEIKPRKGSFYINWGYNRSYYRNTDIEFKGKGFDFTLSDVSAHDLPEEYNSKIYLNPLKFTIPQFDFRLGYFLNEKVSVSFGWDHMKYQITETQSVGIRGTIDESVSEQYAGDYNGEAFLLTPGFVRLEHSDGLNYVRAGIEIHNPIILRPYIVKGSLLQAAFRKFHLENMMSLSAGLATPWTDTHMFGTRYKNWLHVAGWGVSGIMGVRLHYANNIYLQYRVQLGYLRMGDILIQDEQESRAKHDVKFTELSVSLGYNFRLKKKSKAIESAN